MGGATRFAISVCALLVVGAGVAGCAGSQWRFWEASSSESWKPMAAEATDPAAANPEPIAHPAAAVETATMPAPPSSDFTELAGASDVRFRPGQVTLVQADHKLLDGVVRWLTAHPAAVVRIEGHTDDLGTREGNLAAGEQRAAAIRSYLIAKGIEAARISIASAGPDHPLCAEKTDACRARNRRARFLVRQP